MIIDLGYKTLEDYLKWYGLEPPFARGKKVDLYNIITEKDIKQYELGQWKHIQENLEVLSCIG